MELIESEFFGSFTNVEACPKDMLPEYAYIGRSNVGKSSLINMLLGSDKLAKVSNTPGKTQLINYFRINDAWYLVDLPGYGYAKVSKKLRKKWSSMIKNYLRLRKTLLCTFILLDSRHELQKIDLDFINWMGENRLPFYIVYTKIDKVRGDYKTNVNAIESSLADFWEPLPKSFVTSSKTKDGRDDILKEIELLNERYKLMI